MREIEISEQFGSVLWGLRKGRTHKYIRRVPKAGGGYRYYYKTSGVIRAVKDDLTEGAKFRLAHEGQEGHFEVVGRSGDTVTLRHDESGGTMRVSAEALANLLKREHADVVQAQRERTKRRLDAARKHGTSKQIARLEAEAKRFGVDTGPREHPQLRGPKRSVSPTTWDRLASDNESVYEAAQILSGAEPEPDYVRRSLRVAMNALQGRPRLVGAIVNGTPGDMKDMMLSRAIVSDPATATLFDDKLLTSDTNVPMFKIANPAKTQKKAIDRLKAAEWAQDVREWPGWTEFWPRRSKMGAMLAAVADDDRGSEMYANVLAFQPVLRSLSDRAREQRVPFSLRELGAVMMEAGADAVGARRSYIAGEPRLVFP